MERGSRLVSSGVEGYEVDFVTRTHILSDAGMCTSYDDSGRDGKSRGIAYCLNFSKFGEPDTLGHTYAALVIYSRELVFLNNGRCFVGVLLIIAFGLL